MNHLFSLMRRDMRAHSNLVVLAIFILITIALVLPFVRNPMNTLISPMNGDAGYSSILFEAIKREGLNPFTDGYAKTVAYPDGVTINVAVDRVSFFSTALLWMGTTLTNAFFAHSVLAIFGIILSAYISYLFVRRVTGSAPSGFIAGLITGFAPIMIATLFSANIYTYVGFFTLVIWLYWDLIVRGASLKRVATTLLTVFLLLFWTPYYTFHVLLLAGASTIVASYVWLSKRRDLRTFVYLGVLFITLAIFLGIYYLVGSTSQYGGAPHRTIDEIYQQSASPLMYVLPGATSLANHGLYEFLVSKVPRAEYTALYLGITTISLMLVSLFVFRKKFSYSREVRLATGLCLVLAVVIFLFSLAPTVNIAGLTIPTPNYLVAEYVPPLRAGQRLVMPLLASVAVLAGIGASILVRYTPSRWKVAVFAGMLIIIIFDIASLPAQRYSTVQSRDIFIKLAEMPQGVAATYLHNSLVSNPGQPICYYQFDYEMPIINDCAIQRDPYNFDKPKNHLAGLIRMDVCSQVRQLQKEGIKYLIVARADNDKVFGCRSMLGEFKEILDDADFIVFQNRYDQT